MDINLNLPEDVFMKKYLKFIIPAAVILFFCSFLIVEVFLSRTHWNTGFENGNTAGNLYNNGLICERNGTIYFSNPNDNHHLYSMSVDGTNLKKLRNDIASFINADDHYVYYVRNNASAVSSGDFSFLHINTNSLCRYDIKTGNIKVLDHKPSIYASLIGNQLYYIHYDTETASTLYRIKLDGSEKEQVDPNPYFTCSANGQYFYFNGIANDHHIYQLDTVTDSMNTIYDGNCWMPIATNENLYYLDCEQNYALCCLTLSDNTPKILTTDRIESYNVFGDYIYFQRNNLNGDSALCSMKTDGSDYKVICTGNYVNINITNDYVYFSEFGHENVMYRTRTGGDGSISIFEP